MDRKTKLLFLSTGNSARSQMAEGFLRAYAGDRFIAVSAGIQSEGLDPMASEVMREIGIDISEQHSKSLPASFREHYGYVITLSDSARERSPVFPFTPHLLHWSLEDPTDASGTAENRRQVFRRVRNEINREVQNFVEEYVEQLEQASARMASV